MCQHLVAGEDTWQAEPRSGTRLTEYSLGFVYFSFYKGKLY